MFLQSKKIIYLAIVSAIIFATSCGSQKSKNNATETDKNNVPENSATILKPDSGAKSQAAPGENNPAANPAQVVANENKSIMQPPFDKSLPVKPGRLQEVTEGIKMSKQGNLPGAIASFNKAITKHPENGEAYFCRAQAEIELKQTAKALADLNAAIERDPKQMLGYYFRGKLYSDQGNQEMAIADFDEAIILKSDFPDAYNYRGVAKAMLQKHKEAIEDYNKGIKLNPKFAILYYNKGTSQAALKDYKEAIETFTNCIDLDANQTRAYLNRGNCRLMSADIEAAILDFSKVIALNPNSADGYYNRGYAKFFAKKDGACDDWHKAQSLGHKDAAKMIEENCK
jgi:tetratricopeptide (TPR) repeat protein